MSWTQPYAACIHSVYLIVNVAMKVPYTVDFLLKNDAIVFTLLEQNSIVGRDLYQYDFFPEQFRKAAIMLLYLHKKVYNNKTKHKSIQVTVTQELKRLCENLQFIMHSFLSPTLSTCVTTCCPLQTSSRYRFNCICLKIICPQNIVKKCDFYINS